MKTTLVISDAVMARLREEAARQDKTISELVESALRLLLDSRRDEWPKLSSLPSFKLGGAHVDVANREALYQVMEGK